MNEFGPSEEETGATNWVEPKQEPVIVVESTIQSQNESQVPHNLVTETTQEPESSDQEIQYDVSLKFRSADGNFNILKLSDRQLTNEDIVNGFYSREEKMNHSFSKLFKGLGLQLHDPKAEMSSERKDAVESLKVGKPTFLSLDKSKIDEKFVRAAEQFSEAQLGTILFPESGKIMNQFSAIKYADGRIARMMHGANQANLDDFIGRVNLLTPSMAAKEINEEETAYAMEFVQDGERPKWITRGEMEDWLDRTKESGLIFGFDVGDNDPSLDNFVRKDNKLSWVDGNILRAEPAQNDDELNIFVQKQKEILSRYLKG